MFERVSYNVLMFQPYDGNCDVFYMRKYDFSEPPPPPPPMLRTSSNSKD